MPRPVDWAPMTGWLPRLWQQPSAVLLAVQLIGVLLYPFMDDSPIGRAALSTFGLVVLFLAVRAVRATPALTWVAVLLGLPIVVLTILEVVDPLNTPGHPVVVGPARGLLLLHELRAAALHVRRPLRDARRAVGDRGDVHGRGVGVRLHLHGRPGHLARLVHRRHRRRDAPRTWFELLFLSFTNLTSVGLSDIMPVLPHARSWVMIEQVAGLLYVALVISRIVGLTITRQRA